MIRYLLDANAVIALLNQPTGIVGRRVRSHHPSEVGLSAVAIHELYYGAFKSQRQECDLCCTVAGADQTCRLLRHWTARPACAPPPIYREARVPPRPPNGSIH
ncbi:MAG: hypothetical protein H0X65_13950 [Gemmatimonadetes bacterium]|nr:hypothetical protein [Gemmatimonadota bacterium]